LVSIKIRQIHKNKKNSRFRRNTKGNKNHDELSDKLDSQAGRTYIWSTFHGIKWRLNLRFSDTDIVWIDKEDPIREWLKDWESSIVKTYSFSW